MGGEREVVLGSYWSCWWPSGGSPGRLGLRHSPQGGHLAVLEALEAGTHVSLMTAMNTSRSVGPGRYGFVEWKRRAERLVRVSGHPYTIVRPGWFDYQGPGDRRIDLRQGDTVTGRPGVDRRHITQVLLRHSQAFSQASE